MIQSFSNESFNLALEGKGYRLAVSRTALLLKLILTQNDYSCVFEGYFTFEELTKLSKVFLLFNTLKEIEKSLIKEISSKKAEIKKSMNNQVNLNLKQIYLIKKLILAFLYFKGKLIKKR